MTIERETNQDFLLRTGMINSRVYAGIQPDDCVVQKNVDGGWQNASLCNHDCLVQLGGQPTGGNYTCESSFSLNKGCKNQFASRADIVGWTRSVAKAHPLVRDMFFANHFDRYCEEFHIPPAWALSIKKELTHPDKKVEVNRFGGSPEMLKDCAAIVSDCKKLDLIVNLTTPGRRFMKDQQFVNDIVADPPHMLALSFDDLTSDELAALAKMDLDQLKGEWRKVSPHHGQKQKAYEGFYTARLMREKQVPVTILFNMVIHPGNIDHLRFLLDVLGESVPGCLANPYPAQAFGEERTPWSVLSLPALRSHVNQFIEGTLYGSVKGVTKRLHYYVVLESAFRKWQKNPERLADFMGGVGAWDFTLRPGAYRYVQIGKSDEVLSLPHGELPSPGGHIGCFWNPHLSYRGQVGSNTEHIANTILTGMVRRGIELGNVRKSNIMPRLMFDMVSTELGLPKELVSTYLATRKEIVGF